MSSAEQTELLHSHDAYSSVSCDDQNSTGLEAAYNSEGSQQDQIFAEDQTDTDSLFDGDEFDTQSMLNESDSSTDHALPIRLDPTIPVARLYSISIPGLFVFPEPMISHELATNLWVNCKNTFFRNPDVNQVMLFERARTCSSDGSLENGTSTSPSRIPIFLLELLHVLSDVLKGRVPDNVYSLLFPHLDEEIEKGQARQVIVNHYRPGEGISPHVDLLKRYSDGIIGLSLNSGIVMDFVKVKSPSNAHASDNESESVYLPERSIIVLSGEARYDWTHGIARRHEDFIESENNEVKRVSRGERISITFRWLLSGADVVGSDS